MHPIVKHNYDPALTSSHRGIVCLDHIAKAFMRAIRNAWQGPIARALSPQQFGSGSWSGTAAPSIWSVPGEPTPTRAESVGPSSSLTSALPTTVRSGNACGTRGTPVNSEGSYSR